MSLRIRYTAAGMVVISAASWFLSGVRTHEPASAQGAPAQAGPLPPPPAASPSPLPPVASSTPQPLPTSGAAVKPADPEKPAFVTAGRVKFAEAITLAAEGKRAAALPIMRELCAQEHHPADLSAAAQALLLDLAVPELSKTQREELRKATAGILAAEELKRSEDPQEIRPIKRLSHTALAAAVERLDKLVEEAPKYLPAHLSLGVANESLGEYAKADAAYTEYLREFANLELPPALDAARQVRQRLFVVRAKHASDKDLAVQAIGKWTSLLDGAAATVVAQPLELMADGSANVKGASRPCTWRIVNRVLMVGNGSGDGEWFNAGPLAPDGKSMTASTLSPATRLKYTKVP